MRFGLDVSRYQHSRTIDYHTTASWLKWVSGGLQPFVFLNAKESPYLDQDTQGFQGESIEVAYYWFADPTADALADAQAFRAIAGTRPGALDLETTGGLSWPDLALWAEEWLQQEPLALLYSNEYYLNSLPGSPFGHQLWFAGTNLSSPATVVWQYTQMNVPGIAGAVDVNKWIGSDLQFANYFQLAPPNSGTYQPGDDPNGRYSDIPPYSPPPPGWYAQPVIVQGQLIGEVFHPY